MKRFITILLVLVLSATLFSCSKKEESNEAENKSEVSNTESASNENGSNSIEKESFASKEKNRKDFSAQDWEYEKCKKLNVKSRSIYSQSYNLKRELSDKKYLIEKIEFNENGNRISQTTFRRFEEVHISWNLEYDENGNHVLSESYDRDGNLRLKRTMEYDDSGNEIKRIDNRTGRGDILETKYAYDQLYNLIETTTTDQTGLQTFKTTYNYKNGQLESQKSFGVNDKLVKDVKYVYDESGNRVLESIITVSGQKAETRYTFDENGMELEINAPIFKRVFEYNENSEVTLDILYNSDGGRQHKIVNEYYENGLLKKTTRFDSKDNPTKYAYYEYEFYE